MLELCRPRPGCPGAGRCQESRKVPGRKLASPATASCMQVAERGVAGHQEVQRAPGRWGQGLQNPAVSGAGAPWKRVPRSSPRFCRREWASQGRAAFMSRKRARLHSLWEGTSCVTHRPILLLPLAQCWATWSLGAWVESLPSPGPRGDPKQAITIQHVGTGWVGGAQTRKQLSI